ncbi:MAG TPA: MOSC N-terminal beta barrel domain-containing protein, partial [Bacillales bacterium]|nr:MOSC N-terminal beta barrel domain-containing protein [Bacillales bacterium]
MEARGNSAFGKVKEIRRFPVKSLLGESLSRVMLDQRGLSGDRLWAVRTHEGKFGSGKTTRRFMRMDGLMHIEAGYDGDVPVVTMPDGNVYRGDDEKIHSVLSQFVG